MSQMYSLNVCEHLYRVGGGEEAVAPAALPLPSVFAALDRAYTDGNG